MLFYQQYKTILGDIGLVANTSAITHLLLRELPAFPVQEQETPILQQAHQELIEYFQGERFHFDVAMVVEGTLFQKAVWQALIDIPYGETRSYRDIAEAVNSPKAYRAVGLANNNNRIPIIIPCHRVIGADGKMVGFGGGIDIKIKLLAIEAEQRY